MTQFDNFKAKHKIWIQHLCGDDRNSIFAQIYRMIWNAAVFEIINESRRVATVDSEGNKELNGMLHRFIDTCFFESQLMAIRRLTDNSYKLDDRYPERDKVERMT